MAYLIYAVDHDGMDSVRGSLRGKHREHLKSIGEKLLESGALLDESGENVIGGISIIDTDNQTEAEAFAVEDPYSVAGIRKETKVIRWRRRWINGEFQEEINL